MKKILMSMLLTLVVMISLNVVVFADGMGITAASLPIDPICINISLE